MIKDIKIPEISENVSSGNVVEVLVKVGDTVAVDDVLLEMETDKAVVEIPSPYAGRISELLVNAGDEKNVGDVIARIEVDDGDVVEGDEGEAVQPREVSDASDDGDMTAPAAEEKEADIEEAGTPKEDTEDSQDAADKAESEEAPGEQTQPEPRPHAAEKAAGAAEPPEKTPARLAPAAPSVRRLARELGVDIHAVRGSGLDGRIRQEDVNAHVKQRMSETRPVSKPLTGPPSAATPQPRLPDFSRWGSIRVEKLETVRRLTAENTSAAWRIVPQVTQFDEADITDVKAFIDTHGKRAEKTGGKLTITAVLMKVCASALVRFPRFNASIDLENDQLIYKDYVHIGLAVDTPRGLLVPVIRDVQDKGIIDLAVEITDTARRARDKKLKPDEFEGGTFTISNIGGIGGVNFTPVVLWPQAAILGISRARRMLVDRDGDFEPRTILPLCVSYDHRIADGADAARFLDWIRRSLDQAMTMFL